MKSKVRRMLVTILFICITICIPVAQSRTESVVLPASDMHVVSDRFCTGLSTMAKIIMTARQYQNLTVTEVKEICRKAISGVQVPSGEEENKKLLLQICNFMVKDAFKNYPRYEDIIEKESAIVIFTFNYNMYCRSKLE